jgi:Autographiviridae putative DNA helicase
MSLDLTLLRLMKHRSKFDRLIGGLPEAGLEDTTTVLLTDFKLFFKEFPDADLIDYNIFMVWFKEFRHSNFNEERHAMFDAIMRKVPEDIPKEVEHGLMARLLSAEFSYKMLTTIGEWDNGGEFDLLTRSQETLEQFEQSLDRKVKTPFVDDSLEDMLKEEEDDTGFHWRLSCLNNAMRPMRGGDFVIVAARPDKGKTTLLTSELAYLVPQIAKIYGADSGRAGLWFNNEGPGKRIKQRYCQSLLGCTLPEMVDYLRAGTLHEQLHEAAGGPPHELLRILDVHDYWSHEIDMVLRQHPPAFIVFDMIDNIKFSGAASNNGQRTDQLLEEMYKWGRNIAVKYDCPVIATSQISADGDGLAYPTLPMLKDSKTGKQGAADAIITIGALNDPSMDGYRYMGMTKNKLQRSGSKKDPRTEVLFEADRARYTDAGE